MLGVGTGENLETIRGQQQGAAVVLDDSQVTTTSVESPLRTGSSHIGRVVIVESTEGGNGRTRSRYYEVTDGHLGDPVDSLSHQDIEVCNDFPKSVFGTWHA